MLLSFPLSGFGGYLWLNKSFGRTYGYIGGLFYTFIPYHFLNVYVRGNIGEVLAAAVVPWIFYLSDRLIDKPNARNIGWLGKVLIKRMHQNMLR